ncbi:MAG: secondary thiamine-phosphate synthase enzyme YjbQ [Methylophilaceae bacterium]|nr:secondary thiamine-phosphate synthase enzyme YjbQ [Methylophilaceae bacterium]
MRQQLGELEINTMGRKLYDITPQTLRMVEQSGIQTGLLTLYIQHTSASLLINENYDADVLVDMEAFFNRLVPDGDPLFIHTVEGKDDMPAHVRSALTQTHLAIPVRDGKPALGQWQGVFLYEHRHAAMRRRVLVHVLGA